ncbi:hypothetical protein JKP88DRAFT_242562 [Tribonema minus]|uniref:Uncharacterized protein n=1 Tax=Tribonema minus TaxID=303371 RepID=A0A835YID6_9STRA|nr:hypothetical protein JKP88DRAFT_242562 [Tribonema minus]
MSAPIYVEWTFGNTPQLRPLASATMDELQATARRVFDIEADAIFFTWFARGKHYDLSSSDDLEAALGLAEPEVHVYIDEATHYSVSTEVRVAFVKGKATQHFKLALPISFERLYAKAEELFDLQVKDFGLKLDKESENLDKHWSWRSTDAFTVHSITNVGWVQVFCLLPCTTATLRTGFCCCHNAAAACDCRRLLLLLLSICCKHMWPAEQQQPAAAGSHPHRHQQQWVNYAAAVLAGNMRVAAEYAVNGERAHGAIDWVYMYKKLASSYARQNGMKICTATWDSCASRRDLHHGTLWRLVRYQEDTAAFVVSSSFNVPLDKHTTAAILRAQVVNLVARIVALLREQKKAVDAMDAAQPNKSTRQRNDSINVVSMFTSRRSKNYEGQ